jgi:hypothetical protein
MRNYRKLTLSLIAGWFVFAVIGSALHLFANSNGFGLGVAVAAGTPLVLFLIWFGASARFRQFALSLNPRVLTLLQSWRIFGFTFVLLEAHRLLPAVFAWPAGFGDMAVGATATFVAWKIAEPGHRQRFIVWQALGIVDLATAVTLGATAGLIHPQGVPMALMTVLPLSLIPTFLVPLFMMLHVICIAQARAWKAEAGSSALPGMGPLQPSLR